VVVEARVHGRSTPRVSVVHSFRELIRRVRRDELALVAVDIPIGLPESGRRACDVQARGRLGPRRSSVFPAPPRSVLGCSTSWEQANARSRGLDGRGLPRQVFNLLPKIGEVDAGLSASLQRRVFEAHPELSFSVLAGRHLAHGKRTRAGQRDRAGLLRIAVAPIAGAAIDDVLDAYALLWTARRVARGVEGRLGDGTRDGRGLLMEIVY
jgi:predicted RNase H-like nuclease